MVSNKASKKATKQKKAKAKPVKQSKAKQKTTKKKAVSKKKQRISKKSSEKVSLKDIVDIKKFNNIKKLYDEFHSTMLSKGRLMIKDTGIGYWGISPSSEIFELFAQTQLHKHKKFLDLGSGDGRAAIIAQLFTDSTGIEYDEELHSFALDLARKSNTKPKLINQDYMQHSLKPYDYIFIHPDMEISEHLEDKLIDEMSPNAKLVVFGPLKHPKRLGKSKTLNIQGTLIGIYQRENK